jgi:hypothetical protein
LPLAEYRLHDAALSANRPEMIAGRVATLEKALGNADRLGLSASERELLGRSVGDQRRAAAVAAARRAVLRGDPDARRRSLAIAVGRRHGAGTRAKAALSALAPRLARRRVLARDEGSWVGAAGVRVRSGASSASDPTAAQGRDR